MPNYATVAELKVRLGSNEELFAFLTDNEAAGVSNDVVFTECLDSAEGELEGRFWHRIATPVITTDARGVACLKAYTLDLAEHRALLRVEIVGDKKEAQAFRALEWATKVGTGEWGIPGAVTVASTQSRNPPATWSGSNRVLSDDSPRLFTRETQASI